MKNSDGSPLFFMSTKSSWLMQNNWLRFSIYFFLFITLLFNSNCSIMEKKNCFRKSVSANTFSLSIIIGLCDDINYNWIKWLLVLLSAFFVPELQLLYLGERIFFPFIKKKIIYRLQNSLEETLCLFFSCFFFVRNIYIYIAELIINLISLAHYFFVNLI
jgi:hypothetical protein